MLTVKYRDNRGSEMVQPGVLTTSWHEGALTASLCDGQTVTFGPAFAPLVGTTPLAFVMNEQGATVARYDFHPEPTPQTEQLAA